MSGRLKFDSQRRAGVLGGLLVWLITSTSAATLRLDDSASPRSQVQAQIVTDEQGQTLNRARSLTRVAIRFGSVGYRLSTAAFVGHHARIYYVIPAVVPGLLSPQALRLDWRAAGPFASGSAYAGERTPVWNGLVTSAWLNESFDLTMHLDLRQYRPRGGTAFALESYFEIETLP